MELTQILDQKFKNYNINSVIQKVNYIEFKNYMNSFNFLGLIKKEMSEFLAILLDNEYDKYINYKKILLNKTSFIKLFNNITNRMVIALYFSNEMMYYNFDIFIDVLSKYLYMKQNNDSIIQKNLTKYFKTKYVNDGTFGVRKPIHSLYKYDFLGDSNGYNNFDIDLQNISIMEDSYEYIDLNNINSFDEINFCWRYTEYDTYKSAMKYFESKDYNINDIKNQHIDPFNKYRWVSRFDGDGYGFDQLFLDTKLEKEFLVEVKSWINTCFALTQNEFNIANTSPNYYLAGYIVNGIEKNFVIDYIKRLLLYDRETNLFIDVLDKKIAYEIKDSFDYDFKKKYVLIRTSLKPMIMKN